MVQDVEVGEEWSGEAEAEQRELAGFASLLKEGLVEELGGAGTGG